MLNYKASVYKTSLTKVKRKGEIESSPLDVGKNNQLIEETKKIECIEFDEFIKNYYSYNSNIKITMSNGEIPNCLPKSMDCLAIANICNAEKLLLVEFKSGKAKVDSTKLKIMDTFQFFGDENYTKLKAMEKQIIIAYCGSDDDKIYSSPEEEYIFEINALVLTPVLGNIKTHQRAFQRYGSLYNWSNLVGTSILDVNLSIEDERTTFLEELKCIKSFNDLNIEVFKPAQ